ncbi:hypothetical protein EYZ11_012535 [Aspergillus tanneri]|uniref:Uncharacterized protein n=1 Tax=Aspergillus tanneri TaxID=1220188 RepID=A0A4S3J006_9EURO|nr:hypothetical protein EYZ11_012535 [Aspergillus tanneri]
MDHGSTTSPAATAMDLSKDHEVGLKLGEPAAVQSFRRCTTIEIKNRAEKAQIKAVRLPSIPKLASIKIRCRSAVFGTYRIPSPEPPLELKRIVPREQAAQTATLRVPTLGVVVHEVPVKAMGDLTMTPDRDRVAKQLLSENAFSWSNEAEVNSIGWLTNPQIGKKHSAIMTFTSPHAANREIGTNTIWTRRCLQRSCTTDLHAYINATTANNMVT